MSQYPYAHLQRRKPMVCSLLWATLIANLGLQVAVAQPAPPASGSTSSPASSKTAPSKATKTEKAAAPGEAVAVNFVNAEIEAVSRAISVMIKRQIVVDPRVKGQITLYSESPIPVTDVYINFMTALRGQGLSVVESGGLLKVVPEAEAKLQATTVKVDEVGLRGDQVITQIFRIQHESPNNLVAVLRPLISPNNTINVSPGNNSLVITDYADNLQRIAKIIAALDQPSSTDVELMPLKQAVASDVAALVQKLAEGASTPGAPGATAVPGSTGISVLADPRSNSLIVRAPNAAKLAQIRMMVERLDKPLQGNGAMGNIWVVYLKNADAARMATVLRAAFGAMGSSSGGHSASNPLATMAGTNGSSNLPQPPGFGNTAGTAGASAQALAPVQPSAQPSTGGFIQADPASNSLIITANEPLYRQIRAVIDQLDTRRAQVYVESLIVKIDANKAAEFGVQWQGLLGQNGDRNLLFGGTNFGSGGNNIINLQLGAASGNITPPGSGLNLGVVGKMGGTYTLATLARFLESQVGANVLSTPNLVALDNEEAKIVIGQNVPFITGTFTNVASGTGAVNPFQTIERKDVGLTLRIKSQIGEGGTVRMQVFQESSAVVPGATTTAGPTTDKSSIETNVVVDDGQTIVLGGLLKDEFSDTEDRVPGLGGLPVLGNLFKSENRKRSKSNLMVFLRPVVLRTQQSADSVTLDRYEAIRAQQQVMQLAPGAAVPEPANGVLPPLKTAPAAAAAPSTR